MSRRRFLLVYPEVPDTYWSYKHTLSFVGKKALMPPLGLATIAAMIPDKIDIEIVDLNVRRVSGAELADAELVLVSAMIVQKASMERLIARCNAVGTPVVAGGPYATSCCDQISGVAHFVLGEAEETFPQFLRDYALGEAKPIYLCEGRPDLSEAPIPRFDLLDMRYYDTIPIQFSRGCPFNCEFCDIVHLFGNRSRTKPAAQFVQELDAAYQTGFRGSVFVVDDNFIGNGRAVRELLKEVTAWQRARDYPFSFSTEASVNLADDPALLKAMVDAGFRMAFLGIESPVEESLVGAGKGQNLRHDIHDRVRTIQNAGIEVTGGFIIGFDSDPPSIFDQQIAFVRDLAIPTAMVGLLMALPNTALYDRLEREGRILSQSNGNNTHETLLNFVPKMPVRELEAGYLRVMRTIYEPRAFFARCLDLLSRYPEGGGPHGRGRRIEWREIQGLVRSVIRQTFSHYGGFYLRFMFKAIARWPQMIVRIVTMATQGHHYFTITRRMAPAKPVGVPIAETSREDLAARRIRRALRPASANRGTLPQFGRERLVEADSAASGGGT